MSTAANPTQPVNANPYEQFAQKIEAQRQKFIGSQAARYEEITFSYKQMIQLLSARIQELEKQLQELKGDNKQQQPATAAQPNRKQRRAAARKQEKKKEQ